MFIKRQFIFLYEIYYFLSDAYTYISQLGVTVLNATVFKFLRKNAALWEPYKNFVQMIFFSFISTK